MWKWRHLFLLLGTVFAFEHMRSAVMLHIEYGPAIDITMRGEFKTLQRSMHQAVVAGGDEHALHARFLELQRDGLVYFKHGDGPKGVRAFEFGERFSDPSMDDDLVIRDQFVPLEDDVIYLSFPPVGATFTRERPPPRPPWRGPPGPPGMGPPPAVHLAGPAPPTPPLVVTEVRPRKSLELRTQARWALVIGIAGSLAMWLSSIALWLLLRHAEQVREELRRKELLASLGQMSAVVSRELRAPLGVAVSRAERLAELLPEGRSAKRVGKIRTELSRLEGLSRELTEFVESGHVERRRVDLSAWLQETLSRHDTHRVSLDLLGPTPDHVVLDPVTMGRALDNLLDNALNMSPEDAEVSVSVFAAQDIVRISVRDRGPGIPEDVDILAPFVTTREKGTGLGLAITREILEAHGGKVLAENHPDTGAVFALEFPLHHMSNAR